VIIERKFRKWRFCLLLALRKQLLRGKAEGNMVLFIIGLILTSLIITGPIPLTPDISNQALVSTIVLSWVCSFIIIKDRLYNDTAKLVKNIAYEPRMISRRDRYEKKF
jgi:hypothetical protein